MVFRHFNQRIACNIVSLNGVTKKDFKQHDRAKLMKSLLFKLSSDGTETQFILL